jgi:hypothetical protein
MSLVREREIDQAWETHRFGGGVPPRAWHRLRDIKAQIAPSASVVEHVLRDTPVAQRLFGSLVKRRGIARQRELSRLRQALPDVTVRLPRKDVVELDWLSPKPPLIVGGEAGEQQDCLLACSALAYQSPDSGALRIHAGWSLEITDHAAGRFFQRSTNPDLRAAAQEAATAFAAADATVVEPIVGESDTIYLPAGPGAFVGNVIGGKTADGAKEFVYFRAKTWIPAHRLRPDQVPLPRATDPANTVMIRIWKWAI